MLKYNIFPNSRRLSYKVKPTFIVKMLISLAIVLVLVHSCGNTRTPDMYLVPENYVGWITVSTGIKSYPPLKIFDGYRLIVVPASGHVKTSSHVEPGLAKDKYLYYNVVTGKIIKEINPKYVHINGYYQRFIGTEQQLKTSNPNEKPGNIPSPTQ